MTASPSYEAALREATARPPWTCAYCGRRTYSVLAWRQGFAATCRDCADLPALDPAPALGYTPKPKPRP